MDFHSVSLIHFLSMALLVSSFAILASPQLLPCIRFYAVHSFLLASITFLVAYQNHIEHLMIPAVLTMVLKTVVIPQFLFWLIRKIGVHREIESFINIPFSLLCSTGLVFLSFYVTGSLTMLPALVSKEFVPIAIATVFLGMFMMITRKTAMTQLLGLLLLENGLFLMAVTITFGMPLLVELGIFFDVLVAAIMMGIFVFKIRGAFESIDVDEMTHLKG